MQGAETAVLLMHLGKRRDSTLLVQRHVHPLPAWLPFATRSEGFSCQGRQIFMLV
jgi:hypothetical protein